MYIYKGGKGGAHPQDLWGVARDCRLGRFPSGLSLQVRTIIYVTTIMNLLVGIAKRLIIFFPQHFLG